MTQEHSHPLIADSGWITAGFSMQSGWSSTNVKYRRVGDLVYLHVVVSRTGATLTGSAAGNITDTDIVQIPALARPTAGVWQAFDTSGTAAGVCRIETTGMVIAISLHATATIASGNSLNMTATYMIGA